MLHSCLLAQIFRVTIFRFELNTGTLHTKIQRDEWNCLIEWRLSYRKTNKYNTPNTYCVQCSLLVDVLKYLLFVRKIGLEFYQLSAVVFFCLLILKYSFWFPSVCLWLFSVKDSYWSNSFTLNNNPLNIVLPKKTKLSYLLVHIILFSDTEKEFNCTMEEHLSDYEWLLM